MKINFILNQDEYLKSCIDPEIMWGVCSAMTIAWLKRELNNDYQSSMYYYNIYQFAARQRAMSQHISSVGQTPYFFKSDNLSYIALGTIRSSDIIEKIGSYEPGFFMVSIFPESGPGHCVGLSVLKGKYKFFDPNSGEYEVERNVKEHPLLHIMHCFNKVKISLAFEYINITKLQIRGESPYRTKEGAFKQRLSNVIKNRMSTH